MRQYRFWLKIDGKVMTTFDLPEERAEKFAEFVSLSFPCLGSMRHSLKDNFELIMEKINQGTEPLITSQP